MSGSARITIPYGADTWSFDVPGRNLGDVLQPNHVLANEDGDGIIARAIANPIGTLPLERLAQDKREVVIIVDDLTRPTPVGRVVPLLLDRLNCAGISDQQIRIVIALGTHRPMTGEEILKRLGPGAVRRVRVLNSHFADKSKLVDCGVAADGTRLWVDRHVIESDLRIGVGTILPHPVAGWGGGAKIVYPGVGGAETVAHFHLQQTQLTRNVFGDITSPIRANMERWVVQLGLHFIVNVICTAEGKIYQAVAGHLIESHRKGVEYAKDICAVCVKERADIVVASSYPADLDLWQAAKAMMSADLLTKDDGTIILVAPCPEGIGPHRELAEFIGDDDPESLAARALAGEFSDPIVVAVAVTLARMRKRTRFAILSHGLNAAQCEQMKIRHFSTLQPAVDWALKQYGASARLSVIPYGAETLPVIASGISA